MAFSCKCRYFCPSCHAKRLTIWAPWLDATLLVPVPHRQVVLTIPKRRRAYCLYRRRLLGDIARVAARTVTAAIRTLTGERELAVGIGACLQTHGSRANWHPHLHLLVTDGGFRPDGPFVSWPAHDTARLTEAFRRAPRAAPHRVRVSRTVGREGRVHEGWADQHVVGVGDAGVRGVHAARRAAATCEGGQLKASAGILGAGEVLWCSYGVPALICEYGYHDAPVPQE